MPPVQYVTTGLPFRSSYLPDSISPMKSWVVRTSGTMAFLNLPISASMALRPSKKTTSSPRSSTSLFTSSGFRCTPPPITPFSSTFSSSGAPKATISSRTFTDRRGKSSAEPADHLNSIFLKPGNSRVRRTYCLQLASEPPTVPLMPCLLMRMRPLSSSCSHSARCHSITAVGSSIGVKQ